MIVREDVTPCCTYKKMTLSFLDHAEAVKTGTGKTWRTPWRKILTSLTQNVKQHVLNQIFSPILTGEGTVGMSRLMSSSISSVNFIEQIFGLKMNSMTHHRCSS